MRTLRHRESKKIAQIHTASESQSLPLNMDFLPPNLCQLHYTSMKSLGQHMKLEGIVPKITFTPDTNWKFERGSPKHLQVQLTELTENSYIHQFSSVAQSCLTLWPHGLQHARPPCPWPTPGVYPNPSPLLIFILMVYYRKRRQIKVSQRKTCKGQSTGRFQTQNFH